MVPTTASWAVTNNFTLYLVWTYLRRSWTRTGAPSCPTCSRCHTRTPPPRPGSPLRTSRGWCRSQSRSPHSAWRDPSRCSPGCSCTSSRPVPSTCCSRSTANCPRGAILRTDPWPSPAGTPRRPRHRSWRPSSASSSYWTSSSTRTQSSYSPSYLNRTNHQRILSSFSEIRRP